MDEGSLLCLLMQGWMVSESSNSRDPRHGKPAYKAKSFRVDPPITKEPLHISSSVWSFNPRCLQGCHHTLYSWYFSVFSSNSFRILFFKSPLLKFFSHCTLNSYCRVWILLIHAFFIFIVVPSLPLMYFSSFQRRLCCILLLTFHRLPSS
jgi:hypothetical protein